MNYILFALALTLVGCQGFMPKGIYGGIDFASQPSPTSEQAREWRQSQRWRSVGEGAWENVSESDRPVLINGNPVDKSKHPTVVRITSASGSGCTANIVGKNTIITAAHCADDGEKVTFKTFDGKSYSAIVSIYPGYKKGDDLDLAVGKVTPAITGIKPMTIRTDRFEKKNMIVELIGYGCINPGGGGGNDGILRHGTAKVTGSSKNNKERDLSLEAAPSALCYGDSGGPVFFEGKQIGVNSKGNIKDVSWTTRTTMPEAKELLERFGSVLGLEICGVNSACDGSTPPLPPGPKQKVFEDAEMKVIIELK